MMVLEDLEIKMMDLEILERSKQLIATHSILAMLSMAGILLQNDIV